MSARVQLASAAGAILSLPARLIEPAMSGIQRGVGIKRMPWVFLLPNLVAVVLFALLPVFINCASPPHASFRRAASLGRHVGEFFADQRVLYVGAGGLAHDLPGFREPETGAVLTEEERQAWIKSVNERARAEGTIRDLVRTWDEAFLAGVGGTSWEWLDSIGTDLVSRAGNGAAECLTWTAAWAAGGQALKTLAHEFDTNGRAVAMS